MLAGYTKVFCYFHGSELGFGGMDGLGREKGWDIIGEDLG